MKNRYIGRTFITPGQDARDAGVRRKLNPLRENIVGQAHHRRRRLHRAGHHPARRGAHAARGRARSRCTCASRRRRWRGRASTASTSPTATSWPPPQHTVAEIAEFLNVDSLEYLSLDNLVAAIDAPGAGFCTACLTGEYPVPVPVRLAAARDGRPACPPRA